MQKRNSKKCVSTSGWGTSTRSNEDYLLGFEDENLKSGIITRGLGLVKSEFCLGHVNVRRKSLG